MFSRAGDKDNAPSCPYTESSRDIEAARGVYFGFEQPVENWTWNVS